MYHAYMVQICILHIHHISLRSMTLYVSLCVFF